MAVLDDDDKKWLKKNFLTRSEDTYNAIKGVVEDALDEILDEKLDEKINHLPDKDEFYESQDEQMTELKAIRENQDAQSKQITRNSDRIDKLEKIHPDYKHHSSN